MRTRRVHLVRSVILTTLVGVLLLTNVLPAFAGVLEDDPKASSKTNPWDISDQGTYWRQGWGNSLNPELTFTSVPQDSFGSVKIVTPGFIYSVDRLMGSIPTTEDPTTQVSPDPTGPFPSHTLDIRSALASAPAGEWGYKQMPGQTKDIEGPWYIHVRFFNQDRIMSTVDTYRIAIDVTDPLPVTGFTSGISVPTATPRRVYVWDDKRYDALSGVGLYRILVNGKEKGLIPAMELGLPNTFTIEDLPNGKNLVQIQAMDRATNLSAPMGEYAYVDTEVPQVSFVQPAVSNATIGGTYTFKVNATDAGGIADVVLKLDGSTVATLTSAPYQYTCDTRLLTDGNHQIQAFATNQVGTFNQATCFFTVNNMPTVAVTSPKYAANVHGSINLQADATPANDITAVDFYVDNTYVKSVSASPWKTTYSTTGLRDGKHQLKVVAHASGGRTATALSDFYVDNTPIVITGVYDTPDPFYPRYQDGYKDRTVMRATLNEQATQMYVQIFSGSTMVQQYVYKDQAVGMHQVGWKGKDASGQVKAGLYYYRFVAVDKAGNVTRSAKYPTTIRFYELVQVARNVWKVVQR